MPAVSFHTLGCKTNAYETQAVTEQFREAGFEIRDFKEPCDVYVINSCAVTQEAARKSRQMTSRCKRQNPEALVVVTGCYVQEAARKILEEQGADLVVGNGEKTRILPLVEELLSQNRAVKEAAAALPEEFAAQGPVKDSQELLSRMAVRDLSRDRTYESQKISEQEGHVRAYVKIQDGCDRFCSYCLIPFLRGRSRSRRREEILEEVAVLAAKDYHEIVLTGIDISSFSFSEDGSSGSDLATLAEEIAQIKGIERIRLGSLEAGIASEEVVRRLADIPAFCPQFHLSLQSGSDSVLRRMNRHYTLREYADTVSMIRRFFPRAGITTDIITGFPGETEEEFRETMTFARETAFSRIHVFPYSRRPGTRADKMEGQLTKSVKEQRARELIALSEQLRQDYEEQLIKTPCRILVEEVLPLAAEKENAMEAVRSQAADREHSPKILLAGYTPEYVRILVDFEQLRPEQVIGAQTHADKAFESRIVADKIPEITDPALLVNRFLEVTPVRFRDGSLQA